MAVVLVTGGLGFIGSHTVVELLTLGNEVIIVDDLSNSRKEVIEGIEKITSKRSQVHFKDVTKKEELVQVFKDNNIDSIIHFAAFKAVGESVEKPLKYYRNNILSMINLLELSEEFGVGKFVFSSSCTVYGEPDSLPVNETSRIKKAESPYGNTKQIGEEILLDFVKSYTNLKAVSLRYFNPIGAHDSGLIGELPLGVPSNLVPYITQTAIGLREKLGVFGNDYDTIDGTCVRDYIHVVDLAKAHIKALDFCDQMNDNYDFFNVGTGTGTSVLQIIESFEKVTDKPLNYEMKDRRSGDVEKIFAETKKANSVLGWKAERDLDNMMLTAWNWQLNISTKK